MTTRVQLDVDRVVDVVDDDVREIFRRFGGRVRSIARASMQAQRVIGKKLTRRNRIMTVWANDTPKGEPPRTRWGYIKRFINAAFGVGADGVAMEIIGPEKIENADTACLARLEYGDHPFMRPALDQTMRQLPTLWADVLS